MSKSRENGHRSQNGHGGKPARAAADVSPKTYLEGEPFPGRIGRTWDVSEPAFPVEPKPPPGAPNVLYIVLDDVGFRMDQHLRRPRRDTSHHEACRTTD